MKPLSIPQFALGTFLMTAGDMTHLLRSAIQQGYRHIDTAQVYGNEEVIGEALETLYSENLIARQDLFITTKVWCSSHRNVRKACIESLSKLRTDYIDLYLLHWPITLVPGKDDLSYRDNIEIDFYPLHNVWQQMEELHREGLVRNIGVSNWTVALLSDLLSYATVKPLVNQFEMHPYYPRDALIDMCKRNGIIPQAYRVIGGDSASDLLRDETIAEVAKICNATPAQVIIRWVLSNNCSVVVKASSPSRLLENFSSQDIDIPSDLLAKISNISTRKSFCDPKVLFGVALFD